MSSFATKTTATDAMPWCTAILTNTATRRVADLPTLYSKDDCDAEPQCNSANATCDSSVCQKTSYIWCSSTNGCQLPTMRMCASGPRLRPGRSGERQLRPTECVAETYFTCDSDTYQCKMGTGPAPDSSYNSSDACEAACVNTDISGVWRGLRIDSGFQADEWDFFREQC